MFPLTFFEFVSREFRLLKFIKKYLLLPIFLLPMSMSAIPFVSSFDIGYLFFSPSFRDVLVFVGFLILQLVDCPVPIAQAKQDV